MLCLSAQPSEAGCSRAIVVPVAPSGFNVMVSADQRVQGVYPDLLRALGERVGCRFEFPVVPRARLSLMFFNNGEADLFIPASRNAQREQQAPFVPMLSLSPALIHLSRKPLEVRDIEGLLARHELRAAVVRSYSWGDAYEQLMRSLESQKRVDYVADLRTVGAMLRTERVQFTILPPTLLFSALEEGASSPTQPQEFRYVRLEGLPRSEVGAYLSPTRLTPGDLQLLRQALQQAARDGSLRQSLERYYPRPVLKDDVKLGPDE